MPLGGVDLADMEGEWVLYSYERETMIYLNDSAHVIWRLCDGKRTVKEITDVLANVASRCREEDYDRCFRND